MSASLLKTRPQASAAPTWQCVVAAGQCYRQKTSGALFDVATFRALSKGDCIATGTSWPNAHVTLRPVDCVTAAEDVLMSASALCGSSEWERLPDDEAETVIWGGGTKVGPVGAI